MTPYQKMARAFEIFASYQQEKQLCAADHYFLYAGPAPVDVTDADRDELEHLGWIASDESFCYTF